MELVAISSSAARLIGHVEPWGVYDVLASENLKTWVPVGAVKASEEGLLEWEHVNPPGRRCFYRITNSPLSSDAQAKAISPASRD